MSHSKFIFTSRTFNPKNNTATFKYTLEKADTSISFVEEVHFPKSQQRNDLPEPLLNHLLDNLHLVLGISYWKTYAPQNIEIPSIKLTKQQAQFWTTLYTYGMGEFFYKNKLDFHDYVSFPYDESYVHDYFDLSLKDRSLVGVGGGKDSVVAVELLKEHQKEVTAFIVENEGQQHTNDDMVQAMGIESLKIIRKLDPQLKTLEGTYQGHIPISAIYAFLGLTAAVLYDYRYVVVANEHSSNYGNVEYLGEVVNHQWSKSMEFETLLQDYVKQSISPELYYFSLLRQLSELKIVELFVKYRDYFPIFTSCNRNYRINPENKMKTRWCGECPKCAFAFAMLSAFLSEEQVLTIFGKNLFEDENLLPLYRELLGIKDIKPFDCVGTPEEVSTAFMLAREKGNFMNTAVMKMFEEEVLPKVSELGVNKHRLLNKVTEHRIPSEMLSVIENV